MHVVVWVCVDFKSDAAMGTILMDAAVDKILDEWRRQRQNICWVTWTWCLMSDAGMDKKLMSDAARDKIFVNWCRHGKDIWWVMPLGTKY